MSSLLEKEDHNHNKPIGEEVEVEEEENKRLLSSSPESLSQSDFGFLVVSLLFYSFSERDLKRKEVAALLSQTFNFYHLSNYQTNELYEFHSQCNYLKDKKQNYKCTIKDYNINDDDDNNNINNEEFEVYNKQFLKQLSSSKESSKVLKSIKEYCNSIKKDIKKYLDENDIDDEIGSNQFEKFIEEIGNDYQNEHLIGFLQQLAILYPDDDQVAINEAIESFILVNLNGTLFPINKRQDLVLKNILSFAKTRPIQDYSDQNLAQLIEFIAWEDAIAEFSLINIYPAPRDKVLCILRSCRIISKGLSSLGKPFGADEFVGCLVYLIIQTNLSYLYSNVKFIDLFRSSNFMASEGAYYFISLNSAIEYIRERFKSQYEQSPFKEKENELKSSFVYNSDDILNNISIDSKATVSPTTTTITNNIVSTNEDPLSNSSSSLFSTDDMDQDDFKHILNNNNRHHPKFQCIMNKTDEILSNITSLAIKEGIYSSCVRSGLKRFAYKLSPDTFGSNLLLVEVKLVQALLNQVDENSNSNKNNFTRKIKNVFERTTSNHRALKVTLAALAGGGLLALTGGLVAAPLIGAALHGAIGVSILSAISATGLSGTAVTSVLFGAAGATISAERMNKHTSGLNQFELVKVNGSFGLNVVIGALGWIEEEDGEDDYLLWESNLFSSVLCVGETYSLVWENKLLFNLFKSLQDYRSIVENDSKLSKFTSKMLQYAILPSASILDASSIISTSWGKVKDKAQKAGKLLAHEIIASRFGSRPITLVGVSMGARLIYFCLLELVEKKAIGFIENVLFIGAPIPSNELEKWKSIRKLVSGRIVNCFSPSDLLLHYLYDSNNLTDDGISNIACGCSPIGKSTPIFSFFNSKQKEKDNNNHNNNNDSNNNNNSNNNNSSNNSNNNKKVEEKKVAPKKINSKEKMEKKKNSLRFYIDQIENVDVTAAITSHFDYQKSYVQHIIFSHVNINNSEKCPPILIVKPPGIAVLREQQIKEQKLKK
ncbi:hypothetical protein CYY_009166 [Polysphondylium violaceum]|uniref:VPS9 domain-containing protein n=1 Tax=Polysphondylium violaceum TaxID=133409 RepID=A0A8J4PM06_9MYCE|nr:hypothetical protein CYY_009166 [Polysphondylium violaceum]